MIKAAFFDIDGTLLSHATGQVPASTLRALEKLRAAGIPCVVATGRHIAELAYLPVNDLPFDGYITLNGQICLDGNRKMLCGNPLKGKTKERILEMFSQKECPVLLIEEEELYLNYVDDLVLHAQECISSPVPEVKPYSGKEIYMGVAYLRPEAERLLEPLKEDCIITWWNQEAVDIFAKGSGKAEGIRRYLETWGISREETIAFGDGHNDLDMLQYAGIGVAMGNSEEIVKQCADYVTTGIDEDGLELALKHFGLIE